MTAINSNTINITTRTLTSLPVPTNGKSREYSDAKVRHLKAEITVTGTISFWFRAQRDGRRYPYHIGHFPAISPEEARRTALELKAQLDRGLDPTAARKTLKAEPTLTAFFTDDYLKDAMTRKKSWTADRNRFNFRIAKKFGDRKMSSIAKREIALYHGELKNELSVASANRVLVLISAIYRKAIEWEVVTANPASGIKQFRESNARTRHLSEAEMIAFLKAADADENQVAASVLRGLLLTGLRKCELKDRRWSDISLERGELRLETSKNGDARIVQLNAEAKALLAAQASNGTSDWVFPGRNGKQPIENIDKTWRRIVARAGLNDVRIHDLRHTHASVMVSAGVGLYVVSQALGHRNIAQSARYSHVRNDVLAAAGGIVSQAFSVAQQAANAQKPSESEPEAELEPDSEPKAA